MKQFKDLFSKHAADYRSFRPTYPPALFSHLASLAPSQSAAWDVGCGNGQASVALAEHFGVVFATDPSAQQLKNATQQPNVHYSKASAEASGLLPNRVDLTISAQAFHWFNQEEFVNEVRRVSKPQAVVSIWCYGLCKITPKIDVVVRRLYNEILDGYWEPERKLVDENYAFVKMPFERITMPDFTMTAQWSLAHLLGYLHTWSAAQSFERIKQHDPVELVANELRECFGDNMTLHTQWTLSPRAWRLP